MTYNVFGGTLNLVRLNSLLITRSPLIKPPDGSPQVSCSVAIAGR